MRPLRALEGRGAALTVVTCSREGMLDPADVEAALRPETRLIVMTHASNVVGTLLPAAELGALARRYGILLLVDAAQTMGAYPIDMQKDAIDLLAFTGHKSLCGPMGTGGLVIGERVDTRVLEPLKRGGTGSQSEREEQPLFLPDAYESGTPNTVGLAGLGAGVAWVLGQGVAQIRAREVALTSRLLAALAAIDGVIVYGDRDAQRRVAVVAFSLDGVDSSDVVRGLDEEFGIMSRGGLHCAPTAHKTLGTFPRGAVRFGLGPMSSADDVAAAAAAVAAIAKEAR
jgi:selenocysteine lyase/cysteine desulfurase